MPVNIDYSVHAGWAMALIRTLDALGCDSDSLLAQAELKLDDIRESHQRIPERKMRRLWQLAEDQTGDPAFGLQLQRFITPNTFHALGIALWSSACLYDALVRLARYGKVLSNGGEKTFQQLGEQYCLEVTVLRDADNQAVISHHAIDALFASLIAICRSIFRQDYRPVSVELERDEPPSVAAYKEFFCCPVTFGSQVNRIYFDAATLHDELPARDTELAFQAESIAASRLAALDKQDIVNQVHMMIRTLLPSGELSESLVADRLNLPQHQLQRKLLLENLSYKTLLNETRHDMALQYIANVDIPLNEIAYLLGFSEQSNFNRAFKRWTGKTPGQYRKAHC